MVEVAFLDRFERGKEREIKTIARWSGRASFEQNGMVSAIANHKLLYFPMPSSKPVARVCLRIGLAW